MLELVTQTNNLVIKAIAKIDSLKAKTTTSFVISIVSISILAISFIVSALIPYIIKKYYDGTDIHKYLTNLDAKAMAEGGNVSSDVKFLSKNNMDLMDSVFSNDVDSMQFVQGKPGSGKTSQIYRKCFSRNSIVLKVTSDIVTALPFSYPNPSQYTDGCIKGRLNRVIKLAHSIRDKSNKREVVVLFDEIDKTLRSVTDTGLSLSIFCDFLNENFGNDASTDPEKRQNSGIRFIGISNAKFSDTCLAQQGNIGRRVSVYNITHIDDKALVSMMLNAILKRNSGTIDYKPFIDSRTKLERDFHSFAKGNFPENTQKKPKDYWVSYCEYTNMVMSEAQKAMLSDPSCYNNIMSLITRSLMKCIESTDICNYFSRYLSNNVQSTDFINLCKKAGLSAGRNEYSCCTIIEKKSLFIYCINYFLLTESVANISSLLDEIVDLYSITSLASIGGANLYQDHAVPKDTSYMLAAGKSLHNLAIKPIKISMTLLVK